MTQAAIKISKEDFYYLLENNERKLKTITVKKNGNETTQIRR